MEILIVLGILIILIVIKNNKSSDDMPGIAKAYEDLQSLPTMEKNIAETYIDDLIEIVHSNIKYLPQEVLKIEYTKKAYGIEIDEITISNNVTLDNKIKNKNQEVIDNIAITSKENIVKSLNLSQTAKGYYSYRDSSIAKIDLNGKLSLVYITLLEKYQKM